MKRRSRNRRLNAYEVLEIFNNTVETQPELADRYGLSISTVSAIKTGRSHVALTGHAPRGRARDQVRLHPDRLSIPDTNLNLNHGKKKVA